MRGPILPTLALIHFCLVGSASSQLRSANFRVGDTLERYGVMSTHVLESSQLTVMVLRR